MIKKNIICVALVLLIMLFLPWCAVTFVKGSGGMAVCLLLFFIINPILSVCVGLFSGKNIKTAWFQPLLCAVLFLLGAWMFFDIYETEFVIYGVVYLGLGYMTMIVSRLVSKNK